MRQPLLHQQIVLEIAHHGKQLRHAVADWGARGKHHAPPAGQFVQIAAFHQHVRGLLRFGGGKPGHVPHFGGQKQILVVLRFIHIQPVYAQMLKGNHVVLPFRIVELFQLCLELAARPFHLLDGKPLGPGGFQFGNALRDFVDLFLQQPLLPLLGHGDFLKLAVAHDDRVIIAGGNAGAEFLAILGFKVLFGGNEDVGRGIEAQKLRSPLLRQMIGHGEQRFLAKSQSLAFHDGGHHFKRLPSPHFVGQQRISAVQNMGDGVPLVRPQTNFRVHAGKSDMLAAVLPGPGGVEQNVVTLRQLPPPARVPPDPVPEGVLDGLLLLLGQRGFVLVQHSLFFPVCVLHRVIHAHVPEIQRILQNAVSAGTSGAVGGMSGHVVIGNAAFAVDKPLGGSGRVIHLDDVPGIKGRLESFLQEGLNIGFVDPGRAQPYIDLGCFQWFGQGLQQRFHIGSEFF